jgi:hypothetical protein
MVTADVLKARAAIVFRDRGLLALVDESDMFLRNVGDCKRRCSFKSQNTGILDCTAVKTSKLAIQQLFS